VLKVSVSVMLFGRLFHNIRPFTEKALPPPCASLVDKIRREEANEEKITDLKK